MGISKKILAGFVLTLTSCMAFAPASGVWYWPWPTEADDRAYMERYVLRFEPILSFIDGKDITQLSQAEQQQLLTLIRENAGQHTMSGFPILHAREVLKHVAQELARIQRDRSDNPAFGDPLHVLTQRLSTLADFTRNSATYATEATEQQRQEEERKQREAEEARQRAEQQRQLAIIQEQARMLAIESVLTPIRQRFGTMISLVATRDPFWHSVQRHSRYTISRESLRLINTLIEQDVPHAQHPYHAYADTVRANIKHLETIHEHYNCFWISGSSGSCVQLAASTEELRQLEFFIRETDSYATEEQTLQRLDREKTHGLLPGLVTTSQRYNAMITLITSTRMGEQVITWHTPGSISQEAANRFGTLIRTEATQHNANEYPFIFVKEQLDGLIAQLNRTPIWHDNSCASCARARRAIDELAHLRNFIYQTKGYTVEARERESRRTTH